MLKQRQQQDAAGDKQKQQQQQQSRQKQQQSSTSEPGARLTAAKRRQLQARDELAELQHDYSMLKKLKKGKISEHAFDVATGLSSDSEDEQNLAKLDEQDQVSGQQQNAVGDFAPPGRSVVKREQQLRKRKKKRQKKRQQDQQTV